MCSEEISSNSLVWHYYLWPKTPQNSTVVFVMCKNITFFACLGLGLAHMQGFRFRIGTLPLWSRILPTMRNCSKSSKMVSLCLGLKIGLGHFLNIDIMTLVLGFELDWLVLKFIHMWKMWKVVGPCIWLRLGLGYFLGVIWCPNSDMMMNLRIGIRNWIG